MRSSYSRFLYSFPLFAMASSMPFNTGFALDNNIANMSLSKLQGINSGNAANTQDALGVDAHAVGDQSAMSGDSMGAVGKRFANMTLTMSPQCSSDSVLNGLDGAELKFPCQAISSAITGSICLPKLADCSDDKNFAPITVPVGASNSIYGYDFSASCQANCTIKMSQNGAVITNADSINNQSKQAAAKNDQYNMVAQGYVGKDGYSQQQAYLWSFGKGGSNDVIGTQCINGAAGYLASGEYHTCDNSQSGSFKTGCHEEKTCTEWKTTSRDIDTYHQCTLKAKVTDIQCDKVPVVTVEEVVVPAKDVPFSGSTGWTSGGGYNIYFSKPNAFPVTGNLKSFNITMTSLSGGGGWMCPNTWSGHFWMYLSPLWSWRIDSYPSCQKALSYSFNNISIPVTAGQALTGGAEGREYALPPQSIKGEYSGVIEIPEQRHKEVHTTWQSSCPSV